MLLVVSQVCLSVSLSLCTVAHRHTILLFQENLMLVMLMIGVYMLHSSAAGDWVNCGICGEWAHFGCDRRQGLGAFKVHVPSFLKKF